MFQLVEVFLKYLRATRPWLLMLHLVYIFSLIILLSTAYILVFNFSTLLQIYEQEHTPENYKKSFAMTIEIDNNINELLRDALVSTKSDRAYIFRFHNGTPSVAGVPFFFQSNTNEITAPKIPKIMMQNQKVPVSITESTKSFLKDQCVVIDSNSKDKYELELRWTKLMARCPIYASNGELFGFIGVDYMNTIPSLDLNIEQILRDYSNEVTGIIRLKK